MKKYLIFLLLVNTFLISFLSAQQELVFEQTVPSGWKFRKFDISRSGHIAIYYLPDLPAEILLKENHKSYLQIFGPQKNLLHERLLDSGAWFYEFSPGDMILIESGGEYYLLNPEGNEITKFQDRYYGDREVVFDLHNREIALSPGTGITSLPATVIDLNTGKEKFQFGPIKLPEKKFRLLPGSFFLPVGKDDMYIFGFGSTVHLSRYHSEKNIWKIDNVGGNVEKGEFLNEDILAISYFDLQDKHNQVSKRGLILIDWKTGKVIFRKEGFSQGKQFDDWYRIFSLFHAFLSDEGDLCFLKGDRIIRIPKVVGKKYSWDTNRAKKYRIIFESNSDETNSAQSRDLELLKKRPIENKERPEIVRNKYWADCKGNLLRIYKAKFMEID